MTHDAKTGSQQGNLSVSNSNDRIEIVEGAKDNYPDENAQSAALKIIKIAESVKNSDILLVLVSGGGSALLPLPVSEITLQEKIQTTKILSRKGATIFELNTVRKHLSQIKGGKLALAAYPASVRVLISLRGFKSTHATAYPFMSLSFCGQEISCIFYNTIT